jgi:PilZ domain-containing protein
MEPDKRRFVRKRTDQLLYAEFGPDNGSILLNLCEGGCSFQSMAPVRAEQLRFSVSVGDGRKLEGDGQMVWSDPSKKTGGMRFLNPSQELQEQVREWLEETLVTADGTLDPAAMESKAKRRRKKLREEARAEAEIAWEEGALKAGETKPIPAIEPGAAKAAAAEGAPTHVVSPDRAAFNDLALRPANPAGEEGPSGTRRGVAAIALSTILLMTLIGYRRELGHLVMSFGSSIAGDEQKGGAGPAPEARPDTGSVTPNAGSEASPTANPASMTEGLQTPNESGAEGVASSNEQVTHPADAPAGIAQHNATQQGATEDVPSLWTAVENGDTHAEVTLAGRYVRGDAVPQSCAQARVLLEAAVKRGNAEAKQRLDELPQAGCP